MNTLSAIENERRRFILNGNLWMVVLKISVPLALYNMLNHYFGFFDMMIVAHIGSDVVSTVAYLHQLQIMMTAIGAGLALGGGVVIARHYGAGHFGEARKAMNTLFVIALIAIAIMMIGIIPFAEKWLQLAKTPEEMIGIGSAYFRIEVIGTGLILFNNVYMAMEKAKGNTKKILLYNMMVFVIKLSLTAFFVYGMNFGVTMVAVASLLAQLSFSIVGSIQMFRKKNILRVTFNSKDVDPALAKHIVRIGFPVFVQKFAFSFGKVVVNSMSTAYGPMTVGALGISNKLGGCITNPPLGFQDGEATIISQNLGNKNIERALETFKITLIVNLTIGIVGVGIMLIFMGDIVNLFAKDDPEFAATIISIFRFERIAAVTLAISSSVMGMLYGFGYTKLSLFINMMRLFAFRIPTLYILMNLTTLGSESVGISMMVSNILVGVTAIIVGVIVIKQIKEKYKGGDEIVT